ncbi:YncE family protein [Acidicapsa acidisoli]|uniref:YncE family protein n=1 Tax=Acidicapsa acidisoli TaxID=1615681 RepID=UPI0021E0520D|nr:cytochrome D1 domain-containing protein [Acidicapsa acidisoli]
MLVRMLSGLVVMGLFGVAAAVCGAQTGGKLLVVVKGTQSLGIVDPVAGKVIATVSEGKLAGKDTGHEVAASLDGKRAYVPIYGDSGVGKPGSDGREMVVIDLASQKVVNRIDFSANYAGKAVRPHLPVQGPPVAGHPDGLLYVTSELARAISVIDPRTMKVVGTISTGQEQSHMLAVSHDGKWGYTANVGPGTVSVLDLTRKSDGSWKNPVKVIPVAGSVQRIAISMDDKMVFTSDQTKPELDVIDTATRTVTKRIPMESFGYGAAVTPNGRWLLVPMMAVNKIAVIDLKTMAVARNIDLASGTHPQEALVTPDGKRAYVSCDHSGQVAEIDTGTWAVRRMIDTGKVSDGLAWAR